MSWLCSPLWEAADMRYSRNIPALSEAECAVLREKTVAVIGCGGLGGYLIEYLTRIGIGSIRCVDGDVFEESNLNRQLLSAPSLLNTSKANAAAERVSAINPQVQAAAYPVFLDETNARELIAGCDAVLDALDNIAARKILAKACSDANIPLIYGAIQGWVAQAAISLPGDDFIEKLYPDGVEIRDKSALAFTPALCASMQCALATRLLCGREIKNSSLKYFDLLNMEFETIDLV